VLCSRQGKDAEAQSLQERALKIRQETLGPDHPDLGNSLSQAAILHYSRDLPDQAEPLFDQTLQNLKRQFEQHFTYMSEKERLLFLDTTSNIFPVYFSFCLRYKDRNPQLVGRMYDVLLWHKGFVTNSIAALRTWIEASGDKEAIAVLDKLTAKRSQLAALLFAKPADRAQWRNNIEQLEREANEAERQLVKRSTVLGEEKKLLRVTWRDVQKALRKEEAAVEIVRFPFYDGKRWTGATYYVALIVTPETRDAPALVLLGEGEKLERAALFEYREWADRRGASTIAVPEASVYDALWKPLEGALAGRKRIYLSPDGILNQVSFGILPSGDGSLLVERYDLHVVSSTKDILREGRAASGNTAVLIGNPSFGLEEAQQRAVVRALQKTEQSKSLLAMVGSGLLSREQRGTGLASLPGTKEELESVSSLLKKHQWKVQVDTEEEALEETVKHVRSPRILHIATHGFFFPDQRDSRRDTPDNLPSGREDPMLRSGLYFAGANRVLWGTPRSRDLEDGVLTAYEATGLNLQGTELVVLSACNTGLGRAKSGEGVFGLRRALQMAGAEAVLMSMWSVPDRETQELMTLFYSKWLSGKNKHEALREAQLQLRAKIKERDGQDLPFYWGGFVLVGR
jgi:CHAT domain-containing protein